MGCRRRAPHISFPRCSVHLLSVYVLHLLVPVALETFGVEIPFGVVAGPGVENAVVGAAAVSEVAEPGAVFVGIVFVVELEAAGPGAVFVGIASVVELEVAEPGVAFVGIVFVVGL